MAIDIVDDETWGGGVDGRLIHLRLMLIGY